MAKEKVEKPKDKKAKNGTAKVEKANPEKLVKTDSPKKKVTSTEVKKDTPKKTKSDDTPKKSHSRIDDGPSKFSANSTRSIMTRAK